MAVMASASLAATGCRFRCPGRMLLMRTASWLRASFAASYPQAAPGHYVLVLKLRTGPTTTRLADVRFKKRTLERASGMSNSPPRADMLSVGIDVG